MNRKVFPLTVEVVAPHWMTEAAVKREVRAIFQGYPGRETYYGPGRELDDVGVGNGLRARRVSSASRALGEGERS